MPGIKLIGDQTMPVVHPKALRGRLWILKAKLMGEQITTKQANKWTVTANDVYQSRYRKRMIGTNDGETAHGQRKQWRSSIAIELLRFASFWIMLVQFSKPFRNHDCSARPESGKFQGCINSRFLDYKNSSWISIRQFRKTAWALFFISKIHLQVNLI